MAGARFKELFKKYGKVALGVHCSVSAASITGIYVALKNNVDVQSVIDKWTPKLPGISSKESPTPQPTPSISSEVEAAVVEESKKKNRTAELAATTGGVIGLAILCNKALFPIRVPITLALTPPIARFLAKRNLFKK